MVLEKSTDRDTLERGECFPPPFCMLGDGSAINSVFSSPSRRYPKYSNERMMPCSPFLGKKDDEMNIRLWLLKIDHPQSIPDVAVLESLLNIMSATVGRFSKSLLQLKLIREAAQKPLKQ